mmetsp:Transcript_46184/g.142410  ORF Transcript_46184/g.142410 Transcript_46184/m.142410 type:complete len:423 (-) Transcript_46184:34-1302(-)
MMLFGWGGTAAVNLDGSRAFRWEESSLLGISWTQFLPRFPRNRSRCNAGRGVHRSTTADAHQGVPRCLLAAFPWCLVLALLKALGEGLLGLQHALHDVRHGGVLQLAEDVVELVGEAEAGVGDAVARDPLALVDVRLRQVLQVHDGVVRVGELDGGVEGLLGHDGRVVHALHRVGDGEVVHVLVRERLDPRVVLVVERARRLGRVLAAHGVPDEVQRPALVVPEDVDVVAAVVAVGEVVVEAVGRVQRLVDVADEVHDVGHGVRLDPVVELVVRAVLQRLLDLRGGALLGAVVVVVRVQRLVEVGDRGGDVDLLHRPVVVRDGDVVRVVHLVDEVPAGHHLEALRLEVVGPARARDHVVGLREPLVEELELGVDLVLDALVEVHPGHLADDHVAHAPPRVGGGDERRGDEAGDDSDAAHALQ